MKNTQVIQWRHLSVEAAAIVFSILLAFSIDAWWQDHSDQARVKEYLSQVREDTRENLRRLTEALQLEEAQLETIQQILSALRNPAPMALDSAREWTQLEPGFMWYSDPRLLDGSITALVATGDINLVHNPQVKTSLIKYSSQMKADMHEFNRGVTQFLTHHDEILRVFELVGLPESESGEDALANELLAIQNDRNAAAIFRLLEKNVRGRAWYLEQMLAATEELSIQLDEHDQR